MKQEGGDSIMTEDQMIRRDRMRFKNNKMSANLTLLAILFDVLYFVNIYQQINENTGFYYNNYKIGISIIYNLIFMLAAFLSEEGVKNYKRNYSFPLILLGAIQIVRIFILPVGAHSAVLDAETGALVMGDGQFTYLVVLLVLSAVCLVAAAVVNLIKCAALQAHMKMLEDQSAAGAMAQKSA